ncbi:MAG: ABC transporter ATP-binding protein [Planctomycetes bacterium]|nr:ABC transporter ATP-binding protein [Planctomycetota bacterium]
MSEQTQDGRLKWIEPTDSRYKPALHDPEVAVKSFGLCKSFGTHAALADVEVEVRRGDLYGLLGANGAGKTTLLRIAATLLESTRGSMYVGGNSVRIWPEAVRRIIGYMPDATGIEERIAVSAYLEFFALLARVPAAERSRTVDRVLEQVGLSHRRNDEVPALSRGMHQRLALARLLLRPTPILFLDEPLSGLDPRGRVEVLELLRDLRGAGRTIVISSHVLSDLERFCNRIAILEAGRTRFSGPVEEARRAVEHRLGYRIAFVGGAEAAARAVAAVAGTEGVAEARADLAGARPRLAFRLVSPLSDPGPVVERLVSNGLRVVEVAREEATLAEVYFHFTEGKVA